MNATVLTVSAWISVSIALVIIPTAIWRFFKLKNDWKTSQIQYYTKLNWLYHELVTEEEMAHFTPTESENETISIG